MKLAHAAPTQGEAGHGPRRVRCGLTDTRRARRGHASCRCKASKQEQGSAEGGMNDHAHIHGPQLAQASSRHAQAAAGRVPPPPWLPPLRLPAVCGCHGSGG